MREGLCRCNNKETVSSSDCDLICRLVCSLTVWKCIKSRWNLFHCLIVFLSNRKSQYPLLDGRWVYWHAFCNQSPTAISFYSASIFYYFPPLFAFPLSQLFSFSHPDPVLSSLTHNYLTSFNQFETNTIIQFSKKKKKSSPPSSSKLSQTRSAHVSHLSIGIYTLK